MTATNNNSNGNQQSSSSNSVSVANNYFDPATATVSANTTVTWTWDTCGSDGSCRAHNITFDDGVSSGPAQATGTFSRGFAAPGTYRYHCSIHGNAMVGQVVVH